MLFSRMKLLIILSLLHISLASNILQCNITIVQDEFNLIKSNLTQCNIGSDFTILKRDEITKLQSNLLNFDSLSINQTKVHYFPSNFGEIFKNLQMLKVNEVELREIKQKDLKSLSKLEVLDLHKNEIEILPMNLFEFNPKLLRVCLANNKIKFIGEKVFEGLKLQMLNLRNNLCVDKQEVDAKNSMKLVNLIETNNCSNFGQFLSSIHPDLGKNFDKIEEMSKILEETQKHENELKVKTIETETKIANFERDVVKLSDENLKLNVRLEVSEKILNDSEMTNVQLQRDKLKLVEIIDELNVTIDAHKQREDPAVDSEVHEKDVGKIIWMILVPLNCFMTFLTVAVIIVCYRRNRQKFDEVPLKLEEDFSDDDL